MNTPNDGGPVFPCQAYPGMSLRAWLAGMAMQGILSSYEVQKDMQVNDPRYVKKKDGHFNFSEVVALNSKEFADALIAELNKL